MINDENVLKEDKITKQQKYSIFGGYKSKNTLYVKLFNGKITLIKVEKWKMSGKSINDIQGYVGILKAYTSKKTGEPHYYIDNYSLSFANNFRYQSQTPLTNKEAKHIAKTAGIDISKWKDFNDAPDSKNLDLDIIYIDHSKQEIQIKESAGIVSFDEFIKSEQ